MPLTSTQKQSIPSWLATALALLWAVLVPLYMHNRYYDLIDAKFTLTLLCLALFLLLFLLTLPLHRARLPVPQKRPAALTFAVFAYLTALFASWLASPIKLYTFVGTPERYNGLLFALVLSAGYFFIRAFTPPSALRGIVYAILAASILSGLLATANHFGADPFSFYTTMLPEARRDFVGPLGNLNFYSAYLCLCLPLAVYGALHTSRRAPLAFYTLAALTGFLGLFAANTTGGFLGFSAMWLLLFSMKSFTAQAAARATALLSLFCGSAALFGLMDAALTAKPHALRGLPALLARPAMLVPAALFALTALALRLVLHKQKLSPARSLWLPGRILSATALLFTAAFILAVNLTPFANSTRLAELVTLSPAWGSWRGLVWQCLFIIYTQFYPLKPLRLLLGTGPDSVNLQLNPQFTTALTMANGATFDSAHNEYLHLFIGAGPLALFSWLAVLSTHLRGLLQKGPPLARAMQLSVAVYALQALGNVAMPTTQPLLWVLLALCSVAGRAAGPSAQERPFARPPVQIWLLAIPFLLLILLATGLLAHLPGELSWQIWAESYQKV